MVNSILFGALILLVLLAPLPLGSNREWAWSLDAVAVALLALCWSAQALIHPRIVSHRALWFPLLAFLSVCGWVVIQSSSLVPESLWHPLWTYAETTGGITVHGGVSLSPDESMVALLRLCSYGLVFYLAFQMGKDRQQAARAWTWVSWAAVIYAVYGLLDFWGGWEHLFWLIERPAIEDVRATFVNRNSFATWVGLGLLCILASTFQKHAVRRNPAYQVPGRATPGLDEFLWRAWKPLAVIIIVTAALILTHSRGGFLSTLLAVIAFLLLLNMRQQARNKQSRYVVLAALVSSLLAFWVTSEVLLTRLDTSAANMNIRLNVYSQTIKGIEDNPWLGYGYGSYEESFRMYRDDSMRKHFDMAHNTFLENIFELGWPAALMLFAGIAGLALTCWRGVRARGRDWVFPATGLAATVLVAAHSMLDFSLQMPATAMLYALIMGVACAQSFSSRRQ